jgi:DNA-binding LacI/PurR family transcriptional regulator
MVLLFPELHSFVRFDERTSLAVLASSRVINIDATAGYDFVSVDEVQAGIMVGRRARELGATRPCFVGSDLPVTDGEYDETSTLRMRAYEDGLGRRIPGRYQVHGGRYGAGSGQRAGAQLLKLDPMPDFVFAVSDEVAIGLMAGTAAQGVIAGRDYMLIGFDGGAPARSVPGGPLSSVQRPEEAMAHLTSSLLLERLAFPNHPTRRMQIGCTLVEGSTTQPISHDLAAAQPRSGLKR